jgi:DNA-binding GntR family transcriptional regulator
MTRFDMSNINEKIFVLLKKRILNMELTPGSKINLRSLREEFGTSQSPIKDALFRLAGEGLVEINARRGTYVKVVNSNEIEEIMDTRLIIEPGAIQLVAKNISDEQIHKLEKLYQESVQDDRPYSEFMKTSGKFHLEIIRFTKNNTLINIFTSLSAHMKILLYQFQRNVFAKPPTVNVLHGNILEALKERDPDKSAKAMREHLNQLKKAFFDAHKTS